MNWIIHPASLDKKHIPDSIIFWFQFRISWQQIPNLISSTLKLLILCCNAVIQSAVKCSAKCSPHFVRPYKKKTHIIMEREYSKVTAVLQLWGSTNTWEYSYLAILFIKTRFTRRERVADENRVTWIGVFELVGNKSAGAGVALMALCVCIVYRQDCSCGLVLPFNHSIFFINSMELRTRN